jgi:hypothetical protein
VVRLPFSHGDLFLGHCHDPICEARLDIVICLQVPWRGEWTREELVPLGLQLHSSLRGGLVNR